MSNNNQFMIVDFRDPLMYVVCPWYVVHYILWSFLSPYKLGARFSGDPHLKNGVPNVSLVQLKAYAGVLCNN